MRYSLSRFREPRSTEFPENGWDNRISEGFGAVNFWTSSAITTCWPKSSQPQTLQKCDCPKSSLGCRRALASLHGFSQMALTHKVETTCRETVSSCIIFHNRLWVLGEREGPVDIHERAPRGS